VHCCKFASLLNIGATLDDGYDEVRMCLLCDSSTSCSSFVHDFISQFTACDNEEDSEDYDKSNYVMQW